MEEHTPNDVDKKLETINKLLDEYEGKIGLPQTSFENKDAQKYLEMSRDQLEKITAEECAEAAYYLNNLSYHIQKAINRESAKLNWTNSTLKRYISDKVSQYRGSWEQQEMQAIKNDQYADRLNQVRVWSQLRIDRLSYITNNLKNLSDVLLNIQRAKLGKRNG
jgi:hypothetical protein